MALVLPKFDALTSIVDPDTGKPTLQMQKFMEQFNTAIIATVSDLTDTQQQLAVAQGALDAATTVANNASNTASQANGAANPTMAQHQSSTGSLHVTSASWVPVTTLTFYAAVAATSVTLGDSGPTAATSDYNPKAASSSTGNVRVVQVIGGVDTVRASGGFTTDSDGNLVFTPFSYSAADTHTGTIVYRLDVQYVSGAQFQASFLLDVTRNP